MHNKGCSAAADFSMPLKQVQKAGNIQGRIQEFAKGGPVSHFPFISPSPLPYLSPFPPPFL